TCALPIFLKYSWFIWFVNGAKNESILSVTLGLDTFLTSKLGEVILSNAYNRRSCSAILMWSKKMETVQGLPSIVPIPFNFGFVVDICSLYFSSSYNMKSKQVDEVSDLGPIRWP